MRKKTQTSSFGTTKRESHDASAFYSRKMYGPKNKRDSRPKGKKGDVESVEEVENEESFWNQIYCRSSESMGIPSNRVALAFTSPPYNVGKDYDDDLSLEQYLDLVQRVGREIHRVLLPGGRYVINIANLGRKPYIPLHAYFYKIHEEIGFLPFGEIIWRKSRGSSGSCAWGSWKSAKSPVLRDIHEYLLVFGKEQFSREDRGESDISGEEFMKSTLSVWEEDSESDSGHKHVDDTLWDVSPESARRVGHPAPFSVELAARVIRLFTYKKDIVVDPFVGSGTTCVAASKLGRRYVGFDISEEFCKLSRERIEKESFPLFGE